MRLLHRLKNAVRGNSRPTPAQAAATPLSGAKPGGAEPPAPGLGVGRGTASARPQARARERRLLFVGCDASWVQELQRALLQLQFKWHCLQVQTPAEARAALAGQSPHALVVAAGVSGQNELLAAVEQEAPNLLRVVLGEPDQLSGREQEWPAGMTVLSNTLEAPALAETLLAKWQVQEWMAGFAMKQLFTHIRKLPTIPRLHTQVTQELQSPQGSLELAAEFIRQDPAMTAKLLQVVNSAAFGLANAVTDPGQAILLLGAERTRALILMAGVFSQFEDTRCPRFSLEELWNHSLRVGSIARGITLFETEDALLAEVAFTAGLLHEIGQLVLAANLPDMWNAVQSTAQTVTSSWREVELSVLGTTCAQLGGCLLGAWGLPLPLVEAVAWHDLPSGSDDQQFSVLTAVHVAKVFAWESGAHQARGRYPLDVSYLLRLGLLPRRKVWREACGLDATPDPEP